MTAPVTALTPQRQRSIDETARAFEANSVAQMLAPMWETVDVDPTFGGGAGEEIFRGLLVQEYGKAVAASGQLGLTKTIRAQMLSLQEAS